MKNGSVKYLRNCWYVAAWDDEVQPGKPLGRKFLGEPVVLFRDSAGRAKAISDRCPHRFSPLHTGTIRGDSIQCPYHGLEFDGTGQCTHNPHGDGSIPKAARVKAYPAAERHSLVWIWMGDEEKADEALIPQLERMDAEDWYVGKDYLHTLANYQLDVDNIMDLSHIDYLHTGTLGGSGAASAETEVKQDGDTVYSLRLVRNERLSPQLEKYEGIEPGTRFDRWLDVRWEAPGVMELIVGKALTGTPDPRSAGKSLYFFHLFTPETETTSHYWFGVSKPKSEGEGAKNFVTGNIKFLKKPFELEDLPMLEAQQRMIGDCADFWSLKPVLLPVDAPGVRARRVLDGMIKAEQSEAMPA
ncbi:aromatic ring-hydroxylating dioxygenase subunit alpha [Roseibium litorale]|uniref:Aromatic ring-hydroxylating dioxygenase subunit alpha n=1 Tax=Roseibium litorale TaxID=2803841 RepID=A0ABR9CMV4_9HYPH|nr:aromatic ring-hydroxylating dioxygenase subunit alpha [Roseibium litorale]MBD8892204.1 aromatic ring-hydroxylating dioxygenase subunit alpha [Roseibium litorale]